MKTKEQHKTIKRIDLMGGLLPKDLGMSGHEKETKEQEQKELAEKIRIFQGDINAQIMREYLINYGILPTIGASIAEKEKRHKEALRAVYEFGVTKGKEELKTAGYTRPEQFTLKGISDEEISKIDLPTEQEINGFLSNPDNYMGKKHSKEVLQLSAMQILFAKKAVAEAVASCQKQLDGGKK